jgi:hypothetical protein
MKTRILSQTTRCITALTLIFALSFSAFPKSPESEFKILKTRDGIDLYYRWVRMPDGNKVRQMKAVLAISANTEEVITLLKDESRALNWVSGAEQFKHLNQSSLSEWVTYIQFSVPWPLADQDCILEFTSVRKKSGETVVKFKCNPDYANSVEGVKRMKDINGKFVIKPHADGTCTMECYFLSEKRSVIPRWITEPIITGNILNMLEAMRDELTIV